MSKFRLSSSIILFLILGTVFVHAQTADQLQSNIDALTSKIQALDKEIADYNNKISTTQGQAKSLKAALQSLELRRGLLAKEIDTTRLQITQTQTNITVTEQKIGVTESKLNQNKDALAQTLRSLIYENETLPPFVRTLANGAKLSDVVDELKHSQDVSTAIHDKVSALTSTKNDLSTQKTIFQNSKTKLENLTASLSDQKQLVDATAKEKNDLLISTKNKESEYQKMLADKQKKKGDLEAEMLDVELKLKVAVDTTKLPQTGKGILHYPVSPVVITQYFGNTPFASKNPQVYNGGGHNGVDLGVKIGTTVMAAQSGTVVGTGDTDSSCNGVSYGKWVLIRHNNGLSTLYGHLSVIQVSAGQTVASGEKIGLSGNTGYSTGPHVHFTVYASDSVHITGPTEYKSKVCGTYLIMPIAPVNGYLNPLSYL